MWPGHSLGHTAKNCCIWSGGQRGRGVRDLDVQPGDGEFT